MAITTITGLTAQRMIEIEQSSVVSGRVEGDNLILTTKGGDPITAGNVRGPQGPRGIPGGVVDATTTTNGGVRLAGNLKGTAEDPRVTGAFDSSVNLSNAQITTVFEGNPNTKTGSQILGYILEVLGKYVAKSGTAQTIWSGTEAQYAALPTATRNAVGFVAVITP